jgi:hypothetical protein
VYLFFEDCVVVYLHQWADLLRVLLVKPVLQRGHLSEGRSSGRRLKRGSEQGFSVLDDSCDNFNTESVNTHNIDYVDINHNS